MPRRVPIPFAEHSYKDVSTPLSAQELVNLYMEPKPAASKHRVALHGTPGLKLWATVGSGPCRGLLRMNDIVFVVSGEELYVVNILGGSTLLGTVAGNRPVSMAADGVNVVIVSDYYVYWASVDAMGTLPIVGCNGVAFHDGYLLLCEANSQAFYVNDLLQGPSPPVYDLTEFGTSNSLPDMNVGILNVNRETLVFGTDSAQKYWDSGNAAFPFERTPSGVIEKGCASARSIAAYEGTVAWLGNDKSVYTLDGDTAIPISTPAIDRLIKEFGNHSSAQGFIYKQDSHVFYVLTIPSQGTVSYDFATQRWHRRRTFGRSDWLGRCHTAAFDKNLVGSAVDGKIFELDLDTYMDDSEIIQRIMVSPVIAANGDRVVMSRLEVACETGVGLESGQGQDPQLMLDWSSDHGNTWSAEVWRSAGRGGDYRHRAVWNRLGTFRERIFRLTMSDPVKAAWFEAYADMEGAEG